jgi:hypothetical protein
VLPPSLWGRRGFARNAMLAGGVSRVPPLPRPLLDASPTAREGAWWTGSGAPRRPGERAKWPLEGDLAVDGHVASPCLMAIYCKIPLQLPHFTTLTLASSGRHYLPATHPLVQSGSRRNVASEGGVHARPLLQALRCGQNPSSPRERGVTPRPPLDIL